MARTAPALGPGVRVVDRDGNRATVRYVGPVEGTKGDWVGVEWDVPSRGKHNGEHAGRRYFQCTHEHGASFVRRSRLSLGGSVVEALHERYGSVAEDADETSRMRVGGGRTVAFELVGLEKYGRDFGQLHRLQRACLNGGAVSWADPPGELRAAAPAMRDLDVSEALFTAWSVVEAIAEELPALQALRVNDVRFAEPPRLAAGALRNLTTLSLNATALRWRDAVRVAACAPQLTELLLCRNGMAALDGDDAGAGAGARASAELPPSLEFVDIEANAIEDWGEVWRALSGLRRLHTLIVNDNRMAEIWYSPSDPPAFPALRSLSLGGNPLTSWSSIDALNAFPALDTLRMRGAPGAGDAAATTAAADRDGRVRAEAIARVRSLRLLNAAEVRERERAAAEQAYLRRAATEAAASGTAEAELLAAHPRYAELVAVYGAPRVADEGPRTLARDLRPVHLQLCDAEGGVLEEAVRRLPGMMTTRTLRRLIARLFRVSSQDQHVTLARGAGVALEPLPPGDTLTLHALGIDEDSRIVVRAGGRRARAMAERRRRAAERARVRAAERRVRSLEGVRQADVRAAVAGATAAAAAAAPV